MTEPITEKQRYARAYYAKNAERIKAQKRIEYREKATAGRKVLPKTKAVTPPKPTAPRPPPPPPTPPTPPKPRGPRTLSARERLENMRIDKELGLHEQ
ncbi:hypothetical protein GCM10022421_32470 [Oceanisphaera sediminis]|uniref:Uncharacterized protein n=1 Tax=Oceanisphaera sediminis TaxID=981381 RepID=A0ABP7ESK1_9GAMM